MTKHERETVVELLNACRAVRDVELGAEDWDLLIDAEDEVRRMLSESPLTQDNERGKS